MSIKIYFKLSSLIINLTVLNIQREKKNKKIHDEIKFFEALRED